MKKLMLAALAGMLVCGCATKSREVELSGMYVSEAGTLAIGNVEVVASPVGEETTSIKYTEDTAWLSPSTKTHNIKIHMTGTNSIAQAAEICGYICEAFVRTAEAKAAATNATSSASSVLPAATNATDAANAAAEIVTSATTNAVDATSVQQ